MLVPIEVQQNVSYGVAVTTKDSSDGDGYMLSVMVYAFY